MKQKFVWLVLFCTFLVACTDSVPEPTATLTPRPTATATALPATAISQATATTTPSPSAYLSPLLLYALCHMPYAQITAKISTHTTHPPAPPSPDKFLMATMAVQHSPPPPIVYM